MLFQDQLKVMLKLSLIMGLTWIFELAGFFVNWFAADVTASKVFVFADVLNLLQVEPSSSFHFVE